MSDLNLTNSVNCQIYYYKFKTDLSQSNFLCNNRGSQHGTCQSKISSLLANLAIYFMRVFSQAEDVQLPIIPKIYVPIRINTYNMNIVY